MEKKIFQIQIALKGFKPKIWRRILVPSDMLFSDFHKVIQTTMGWTNSHLHQFRKNRTRYAPKSQYDDLGFDMDIVNYGNMKISDLLTKEKEKIFYEYDFGDGREHDIILEKILPFYKKSNYPICLKGKMSYPPDDCGGIWGYSDMLEILKQPDHEEYEEWMEWVGGEFDPTYFDIGEINEMLKTKDYGCIEIFF